MLSAPQKIHWNIHDDLARCNSEKYFWNLPNFSGIQAIGVCCLGQKESPELFAFRSISQKCLMTAWKNARYLQGKFIRTIAKGLKEPVFLLKCFRQASAKHLSVLEHFYHTDSVFQTSHFCIPCKPKNTHWHHWAMHWHQEYRTKPTEVVGSQNCAGNSSSQFGQTNFWNHPWFKNCDLPRVLADPTPCHAQHRWQHFSPPQPHKLGPRNPFSYT